MNEDNIQGMIGQAKLASGTPSVESTLATPGMGFAAEQASSVFGQPKTASANPLETQYQQMLATAKKAANERKKVYLYGVGANQQPNQQPANMAGFVPSVANEGQNEAMQSQMAKAFGTVQQPMPSSAAIVMSAAPQLSMRKKVFGKVQSPSYDYNGMSVSLPDDLDTNDPEAVRKAIDESNMYLDLIMENEEEEF